MYYRRAQLLPRVHKRQKRPDTNQGIGARSVQLFEQCSVGRNRAAQQFHLGVSLCDQSVSLANQSCAFCRQGCESLMLICEISAGSGVTGKLGAPGGAGADVVLQACNAGSISSAASFQGGELLRVVIGVVLLRGCVVKNDSRFLFCSFLRFLCLRLSLF